MFFAFQVFSVAHLGIETAERYFSESGSFLSIFGFWALELDVSDLNILDSSTTSEYFVTWKCLET